MSNIKDNLPVRAGVEELFDLIIANDKVRIERIVSHGHSSPAGFWYDQSENEWIILISGAAAIRQKEPDKLISMVAGDYLLIPAHRKHRVESTKPDSDTIWLAVFWS